MDDLLQPRLRQQADGREVFAATGIFRSGMSYFGAGVLAVGIASGFRIWQRARSSSKE